MIEIRPFRALIYNKPKVKKLNQVIAPPYDIISSKERDSYYRINKYNIIRIILGKNYSKDSRFHNRYSRAARFLKEWQKESILIQDDKPSIYVYLQNYLDLQQKKRIDRLGFISLFKLQDFGQKTIYPHEWTLSKPKADRFKLLKATSANYSPIFSLYYDRKVQIERILKKAINNEPFMKVIDNDKTVHALYRITDPIEINKIKKFMECKRIFIADGHHRYETALKYCSYAKKMKNKKDNINSEYTMMYFTNLNNKGLKIYPVHRVINNIAAKRIESLLNNLKKYFHVMNIKNKDQMLSVILSSESSDYKFGLYCNRKFYLLSLKDKNIMKKISKKKKPSYIDRLNVTLLHNLIIKGILKADNEKDIDYLKDPRAIIDEVNKKKNKVGFFVCAITSDEIIKAALQNERLPRKSTYFYPKLYSGLVINKLNLS